MRDVKKPSAILGDIEKAQSVAELKDIASKANALQEYARQAGYSLDEINDLAEGRVMAMCKGGFILRGLKRDPGGNPLQLVRSTSEYRQALNDAGPIRGASVNQSHPLKISKKFPFSGGV